MKTLIVKNMLAELIAKQGCSIPAVAKKTGVSGKTIRHILANSIKPSIKAERNLINFYCYCTQDINHQQIL